jgi:hypothetical protein
MPRWLKWSLSLAAACAALGTWLLTVAVWPYREADVREWRYERELMDLRLEYRQVSNTLNRLARLHVVRPLLPDSPGLVVRINADAPPELAGWLAAGAAAEYSPAPLPRLPVVIALRPRHRFGDVPGLNFDLGRDVDFFAGADSVGPFCAVVGNEAHWRGDARWQRLFLTRFSRQPLGPCRLWAKYGAPGEGVRRWLAAGAMAFTRNADLASPLPDSLRTRHIFGGRREHQLDFLIEPCLAGNARRCREALLRPGQPPSVPTTLGDVLVSSRADDWFWREWPRPETARLLASLEAEHGTGRFAGFWTSAEDVERAFQDAFGTPLEVWAIRSLQAHYGRAPIGPRLAASTLLLSFVTLGLLIGVAVAVSRRRTVG